MKELHAYVSGRVQGVFFRAWTRNQARQLGLTGWVRNVSDGRVEVTAQGPDHVLKMFQRRLGEGPPMSRVDGVDVTYQEGDEPFAGFEITASSR
ncbi:acylphosphatase [Desulfonatronum thiosulfatophilum]|uniref:Acylphosphatase n=1 Tax=Desulfonatronum thiosulfatophilum TaxID=617002 RepID=A0A1G6DWG5_9BACT|nr:acylphosphatase [Desulfonatronum thiosulfatophilum]SDB49460.1 acylphosphatase [Desulfonatronum thiosulfatophilum]